MINIGEVTGDDQNQPLPLPPSQLPCHFFDHLPNNEIQIASALFVNASFRSLSIRYILPHPHSPVKRTAQQILVLHNNNAIELMCSFELHFCL